MLLLNLISSNIAASEVLFRYGTSISGYAWLLVSFLVYISSTALAVPPLIALKTLLNLLE